MFNSAYYLKERLVDLERATMYLTLLLTQPDRVFHNDEVLRDQLVTLLSEITATKRKMSELSASINNPEVM